MKALAQPDKLVYDILVGKGDLSVVSGFVVGTQVLSKKEEDSLPLPTTPIKEVVHKGAVVIIPSNTYKSTHNRGTQVEIRNIRGGLFGFMRRFLSGLRR